MEPYLTKNDSGLSPSNFLKTGHLAGKSAWTDH
jgi:hypothetical protein